MSELKRRVRRGSKPVNHSKRSVRPDAKRVTEHATQIASRLDAPAVGTNHLLLGILFVDNSIACDVFTSFGLHYDGVMAYINKA